MQNKSIAQLEDSNSGNAIEVVVNLQNAESNISAYLKHKCMKVNKVACSKNLQPKTFQKNSQN